MIEKLNEAKELIKAGKYDEAIAKIDEVIAAQPEAANFNPDKDDPPLPGQGTNY